MNIHQRYALAHHCRLALETVNPAFGQLLPGEMTAVLTVDSGYE